MISYYIALAGIYILSFMLSGITALPDATLSPLIAQNLATFGGFLPILDTIFPVYSLFAVLGIIFAIELSVFVYKIIMWILRKIPFVGIS